MLIFFLTSPCTEPLGSAPASRGGSNPPVPANGLYDWSSQKTAWKDMLATRKDGTSGNMRPPLRG